MAHGTSRARSPVALLLKHIDKALVVLLNASRPAMSLRAGSQLHLPAHEIRLCAAPVVLIPAECQYQVLPQCWNCVF